MRRDPRDRRSPAQRRALRQRARKMQKRKKRELTRAEKLQIGLVLGIIAAIIGGSILVAQQI